jgi:hypothetical protein
MAQFTTDVDRTAHYLVTGGRPSSYFKLSRPKAADCSSHAAGGSRVCNVKLKHEVDRINKMRERAESTAALIARIRAEEKSAVACAGDAGIPKATVLQATPKRMVMVPSKLMQASSKAASMAIAKSAVCVTEKKQKSADAEVEEALHAQVSLAQKFDMHKRMDLLNARVEDRSITCKCQMNLEVLFLLMSGDPGSRCFMVLFEHTDIDMLKLGFLICPTCLLWVPQAEVRAALPHLVPAVWNQLQARDLEQQEKAKLSTNEDKAQQCRPGESLCSKWPRQLAGEEQFMEPGEQPGASAELPMELEDQAEGAGGAAEEQPPSQLDVDTLLQLALHLEKMHSAHAAAMHPALHMGRVLTPQEMEGCEAMKNALCSATTADADSAGVPIEETSDRDDNEPAAADDVKMQEPDASAEAEEAAEVEEADGKAADAAETEHHVETEHQPPMSKWRKKLRDRESHRAEAAATDAEMEDEEHVRASSTANNAVESVLREDRLSEPAYVRVPPIMRTEWPTAMGAQGLSTPARLPQREWTGGQFIPASEAASVEASAAVEETDGKAADAAEELDPFEKVDAEFADIYACGACAEVDLEWAELENKAPDAAEELGLFKRTDAAFAKVEGKAEEDGQMQEEEPQSCTWTDSALAAGLRAFLLFKHAASDSSEDEVWDLPL